MSDKDNSSAGCGCLIIIFLIYVTKGTIFIPIIALVIIYYLLAFIYRKIVNALSKFGQNGYKGTDYNQKEPFGGKREESKAKSSEQSNELNIEFLSAVARLTGYISRGAGRITKEHIDIVSNFIDLIGTDTIIKSHLQEQFDVGKNYNFDPTTTCHILKRHLQTDFDAQTFILNLFLSLIFADNYASDEELHRLYKVCDLLGIPRSLTDKKISEYKFASGYKSNNSSNSNYQNENSRSQNNNSGSYNDDSSNSSSSSDFDDVRSRADALRILGLSNTATSSEIKRQYLKLMKEYHPDRLKAKGITGRLKDEYEKKCKLITSAYNYLK